MKTSNARFEHLARLPEAARARALYESLGPGPAVYGALILVLALVMRQAWTAPTLLVGGDAVLSSYPQQVFWRESLAAGEFPFWNPYRLNGAPAFAHPQAGYAYPPHWAMLWAPPHVALNWLIGLHVLLAGLGIAWCAGRIGAPPAGQFPAGLTFALGSATTARLWAGHLAFLGAMAWLPLATGLAIGAGRRRSVEVLAVVVGMMTLAGQPELPILCLWWLPLWTLLGWAVGSDGPRRDSAELVRRLLRTGVGIALGLGLGGVLLLPLTALHAVAARETASPWDSETGVSLPPWHLLTSLAPLVFGGPRGSVEYWPSAGIDWHERLFYLGLVPLAAAIRAGTRWRWACWGAAAVAAARAFGRYVPWYAWAQAVLPGYDSMRVPPKHLTLVALALALAAGLGLQRLHGRRIALGALAVAAVLALARLTFELWFPAWAALLGGADEFVSTQVPEGAAEGAASGLGAAAVMTGLLGLIALLPRPWALRGQVLLAALGLVLVLGPFRIGLWDPEYWVARYQPLREFERAAVIGRETIMAAQLAPLLRVTQPAGYSSLITREYGLLVTGTVQPISVRTTRVDDPILPLLGVQAVFDFTSPVITVVASPKPAAWIARCARPGGAREVRAPEFPRRECVTLAEPVEHGAVVPPAEAEVIERRPGWLLARADGPGWLVTLEHAYPGWSAWIESTPAPVIAVDGALVGVRLPDGPHTVALRYRPARLELGALISLAAAFVLLASWALGRGARRLGRTDARV